MKKIFLFLILAFLYSGVSVALADSGPDLSCTITAGAEGTYRITSNTMQGIDAGKSWAIASFVRTDGTSYTSMIAIKAKRYGVDVRYPNIRVEYISGEPSGLLECYGQLQ